MNENPEGTPNPLNPNPGETPTGAEPVTPVEQPATVDQPVPTEHPVEESTSSFDTMQPEQPTPEPMAGASQASVDPLPSSEPVHDSSSVVVDKPKKKTGLIVAIILFIVAIAGGVAAALIVLNPFGAKKDAVATAISKLINGETPKLVKMDGAIDMSSNNSSSPLSSLSLKLDFSGNTTSNNASVDITATLEGDTELSFRVDERMLEKNLYIRLSNISEALNNYMPMTDTKHCADYEDETDCIETPTTLDIENPVTATLNLLRIIDNEWIQIPTSYLNSGSSSWMVGGGVQAQCLVDMSEKLNDGSEIAEIYNNNQFVGYTTDGLKVAQKNNTLYKLTFDAEKLAGFMNSVNDSEFAKELYSCMGARVTGTEITAEQASTVVDALPEVYVEINGDYYFTRLYMTMADSESNSNMKVDLSISYPESLEVSEPEQYIDLNEAISKLLNYSNGDDVYDYDYDYDYDYEEEDDEDDEDDEEDLDLYN